jgi:hypothetical protein
MLVDAGNAISDAGHSDGGNGSDASAQESGDGLPRSHWVLKDKNGTPVKADVYPSYVAKHPRFSESAPECVSIQYMDKRTVGLVYVLSTGKSAKYSDCASGLPDVASWRESPYVIFLDSGCSTQPAISAASFTLRIAETLYYSDGTSASKPSTYYHWNTATQNCDAVANPTGTEYWPYKLVPADVLNLLPHPPYTMELVY